jgi:CTP synthase
MVIEFCRNVLGLKDSTSSEFDTENISKNHVIVFMPEIDEKIMGGNMRLGSRPTTVLPNLPTTSHKYTLASDVYGLPHGGKESVIFERHRHRYEVNPAMTSQIEEKGLYFSGKDDSKERMEIVEISR